MRDSYKLKLELLSEGIDIDDRDTKTLNNSDFLHNDYITTSGIEMNYEDIYVTVTINKSSKYHLIYDASWKIIRDSEVIIDNVKFLFPPMYASKKEKLANGNLVTEYVNTHGDRIRIQPIGGCANSCRFCSCNDKSYIKYDINTLDKAFKIAKEEGKENIRHVLISSGTPKQQDYDYMTQVYTYFIKTYKELEFDIMMSPRGFKSSKDLNDYKYYIEYLEQIGVYGLSINIELYNDEFRKKYIPQKNEIGLQNYIAFLENAVNKLGTKRVRSCIIVGLKPIEDTIKGVELLCQIGCIPVLSPYVPKVRSYQNSKVYLDTMLKVREQAEKISNKYNVPLGPLCKQCSYNTI